MNTEITLQTVNSAIQRNATASAPKISASAQSAQYDVRLLPTGSLFDCVGVVLDLSMAIPEPPAAKTAPAPQPATTSFSAYARTGASVALSASQIAGDPASTGQVLDFAA